MKTSLPCIGVIGGDIRQFYAAVRLSEEGFPLITFALPRSSPHCCLKTAVSMNQVLQDASVLLCPTPFTKDNLHIYTTESENSVLLSDLYVLPSAKHFLFAGSIPDTVLFSLKQHGFSVQNFSDNLTWLLANTVPTAEGAIAEAILHKDTVLSASRCLVLGYGKCGATLADRLLGMKAQVSICDRDAQALAYARAFGFLTFSPASLERCLPEFDYIFNTVPDCVLPASLLEQTAPDVLIIDIASKPGGADCTAAQKLNRLIVPVPALPGRYAPKTAGETIADYVIAALNNSEKEGIL